MTIRSILFRKNGKCFLCKDFTVGANLFVNALFISVQALQ